MVNSICSSFSKAKEILVHSAGQIDVRKAAKITVGAFSTYAAGVLSAYVAPIAYACVAPQRVCYSGLCYVPKAACPPAVLPAAAALGCAYVIHKGIKTLKDRNPVVEAESKSLVKYLPYAGIVGGMITGVASRISEEGVLANFSEKSRDICRAAFSHPILKRINFFKQWEIKTFALLSPMLPLAVQVVADAVRSNNPGGILARLKEATQNNLTRSQLISLALIAVLGLTNGLYAPALGITSKAFDASGHMMLKTILSQFLSLSLGCIAQKGGIIAKTAAAAYASLYAFTDGVLVHNTVRACHTVAEAVAGFAWGLGIANLG